MSGVLAQSDRLVEVVDRLDVVELLDRAEGPDSSPGRTGPSGSAGSFEIRLTTSIRKPSTPRSSHQRIIA